MNIKPLLLTLGALTTASSVSGCTVHSAKPSYTLRHSNLGDAGDMKRVVVTESKTRFWGTAILAAAGLITPAFLGEELSGNGLVVGAFTGLMFDISTTYLPWGPYVETGEHDVVQGDGEGGSSGTSQSESGDGDRELRAAQEG